eukprot:7334071-Ditylum_brightwellii.AAC.1
MSLHPLDPLNSRNRRSYVGLGTTRGQQLICSKTRQCQNDDNDVLQASSKRNDNATMPILLALSSAVDI